MRRWSRGRRVGRLLTASFSSSVATIHPNLATVRVAPATFDSDVEPIASLASSLGADRAFKVPTSSSFGDEKRVPSLLLSTAPRDPIPLGQATSGNAGASDVSRSAARSP